MQNSSPTMAGLFAGVGGIELGFKQAGFTPVLANEIDKHAGVTYGLNHVHPLILRDRRGFKDPRGNVFWEIVRILDEKKPSVVFLENVKNLTGHDGGKTFQIVIEALEALGYHVTSKVMNAAQYSRVPQNRERIYIVGFLKKKDFSNFEFPKELKAPLDLAQFIDFDSKVDENFYYRDKYMSKELERSITSQDTVYQWRRHYVRENKSGLCPTLTANMGTGGHNVPLVLTRYGIRKLTPRECFNLMGFPKSFKLPVNMANSQLYKQAGNAVVVPVIKRIASEIMKAIN